MTWLVIGISGATCSGKTTLAKRLHKKLNNSIMVEQDTYFLPDDDPRHTWIEELNHANYDILSSLDMEKMHFDLVKILNEKPHGSIESVEKPKRVLIIEGFLIFAYKPVSDLCSLKYFITLDKEECWNRRKLRAYEPPDVPGYFEQIVWPEYEKQKEAIVNNKELLETVKFFDGTLCQDEVYNRIFTDIKPKLK